MQLAPSALHATAETLGGYLGWTLNELISDDIISLDGPQDRQIGMRLLGNGSNIQLWATGGTEPADHEPTEGATPLPRGHRWHTWIDIGRLEADKDPATLLYNTITDRLLPAFDTKPLYVGHRPWEGAFDSALSEVLNESALPPEAAPEPQAATDPAVKVIPMRTRRAKADTPSASAEPEPRPARKRTPAKPTTC
ncbi:hypothetical protein [Streptomyces rhizosphaerihabitans]|uniref:hypothetical protein n=1 Tax=Streptomyces rhizosphaerihabitans TaxID=1266770 RepID=UPI0021C0EA6E|nr:hypothetical protein [Streptomyces rhizosphaerihabitans]MCT9003492.1 hypothetical protein [Streptomyces rhizosphaerihabitans]